MNDQSTNLLFEISHAGRRCHRLPACDVPSDTGLPRETFDLVYCRFLLLHLPEPEQALDEMLEFFRGLFRESRKGGGYRADAKPKQLALLMLDILLGSATALSLGSPSWRSFDRILTFDCAPAPLEIIAAVTASSASLNVMAYHAPRCLPGSRAWRDPLSIV